MRCSKCRSDNREGRKFCTTCGTALVASCPKCGAPIQLDESFCGECGTALGEAASAAAADSKPVTAFAGGERRYLTVLFCDLVGSTEIAARLDPEEWREVVAGYQRAAAEGITRYGGHVAKYLGDGVMAYFGYPEAHDNDAERAARASLAILDALSKLNHHSRHSTLTARVGIDSGSVVVGPGAGQEPDVFGDVPNVAARVQTVAEPGTVLATDAVQRLVAGLFVVDSRGAVTLKGLERPVQLYRIIRASGVRGRLEAIALTRGLTPFVGRDDELRLLMNRWERAREGEGQVVLAIGEPGIGKSRLLQRFHELLRDNSQAWVEAAAAPFFQNTPFYSVSEVLRQLIAVPAENGSDDTTAAIDPQFAQLEAALRIAGLEPPEAIPLIAPLLNLPLPAKYTTSALPPEQQRRRLLATLVDWVLAAARRQPLVISTEDLHWADVSTLEVIQLLVEQGATSPLLLLYTARPEFRPQWPLRAHHTQITLNRLSARDIRTMVQDVAARKALSDEAISTVIERTGGVPLFVEELTRAMLESSAKLTSGEIPVTLHDSLMARLDRLGAAKERREGAARRAGPSMISATLYQIVRTRPEARIRSSPAADSARFGFPDPRVGVAVPPIEYLPYVSFKTSLEFMLLAWNGGEMIDAHRACELGMVNRLVPDAELMTEATRSANLLKKIPPGYIRAVKYGHYKSIRSKAADDEWEYLNFTWPQEKSEDRKEGQRAFIERREPLFKGR
jgi:class 3 adenylate cyclase